MHGHPCIWSGALPQGRRVSSFMGVWALGFQSRVSLPRQGWRGCVLKQLLLEDRPFSSSCPTDPVLGTCARHLLLLGLVSGVRAQTHVFLLGCIFTTLWNMTVYH